MRRGLADYRALALGNIAGLAVALGMDDEEIEVDLCEEVHKELIAALNDPKGKFQLSVDRARERLHFVSRTSTSRV